MSEYNCIFTYDLRQKKKRWKDGVLKVSADQISLSTDEENESIANRTILSLKLSAEQLVLLHDEQEVRVGNVIVMRGTNRRAESVVPMPQKKKAHPGPLKLSAFKVPGNIGEKSGASRPQPRVGGGVSQGFINRYQSAPVKPVLTEQQKEQVCQGVTYRYESAPVKYVTVQQNEEQCQEEENEMTLRAYLGLAEANEDNTTKELLPNTVMAPLLATAKDCLIVLPMQYGTRLSRKIVVHSAFVNNPSGYCVDFASAVAEEITLGLSSSMQHAEMVTRRALGLNNKGLKRDRSGMSARTNASVASMIRRSTQDIKNLLQSHGAPFYVNVQLFVSPPKEEDGDEGEEEDNRYRGGDSGKGTQAQAHALGSKEGTKLYLKFDPDNKDCPMGCEGFGKDDIWALWAPSSNNSGGNANYPLPWSQGQCRDPNRIFLVRSLWHSIAQSGMLEVAFLDLSTTIPSVMGRVETHKRAGGISGGRSNAANNYADRYANCAHSKGGGTRSSNGDEEISKSIPPCRQRGPLATSFAAYRLGHGQFMHLMAYDLFYSGMQRLNIKFLSSLSSAAAAIGSYSVTSPCRASLQLLSAPIFHVSLGGPDQSPSTPFHSLPRETVISVMQRINRRFRLNADQREVLTRVAGWFCSELRECEQSKGKQSNDDIILVRGTFGSGKSHLLAAVTTLISRLGAHITAAASEEQGIAVSTVPPCRIMISSNTNVAVDRVLGQLAETPTTTGGTVPLHEQPWDADLDIEASRPLRLARLGQLSKIDKALRPNIVHTAENPEHVKKEIMTLLKAHGGSMAAVREGSHSGGSAEQAVLVELLDLSKRADFAQEQRNRLMEAEVVGVTCASSMSSHLSLAASGSDSCNGSGAHLQVAPNNKSKSSVGGLGLQFDVLVLDEASQMSEAVSSLAMSSARPRRMIIVGDPKQLPPILESSSPSLLPSFSNSGDSSVNSPLGNLECTLYDRLLAIGWKETMLRTQYRCHPHIAGICSRLFYENRLMHGITAGDRRALVKGLAPTLAIHCGEGNQTTLTGDQALQQHEERVGDSFVNRAEARTIVSLVDLLRRHAHKGKEGHLLDGTSASGGREMMTSSSDHLSIGVICAYRAQARHIASLLPDGPEFGEGSLKVSTVDAFQGQERDIIIYATTRTSPSEAEARAGAGAGAGKRSFLFDQRRSNVALSRAKYHFFLLGNLDTLRGGGDPWDAVLKASSCHKSYVHFREHVEAKFERQKQREEDDYYSEQMGL